MKILTLRRRWVALIALMALALGGLAWWLVRGSRGSGEGRFRLLPADSSLAAHVDLAALRNNALLRRALASQAGPALESDYGEFVRATGFDFERDLDSLALAVSGRAGARSVHAILDGRFNRERLERYSRERRRSAITHRGRSIDEFAGSSGNPFRMSILSDSRLVFSTAAGAGAVIQMIDRAQSLAQSAEGTLQARLQELHVFDHVPPGSQAWIAVDLERAGHLNVPSGASSGTSISADVLRGSRMGLLAAHVGDKQIELRLVAECQNGGEAQRVAQSLTGLRALLAALAAREKDGAELARALQSVSVSVEKNAAVANWSFATAWLERLLRDSHPPQPASAGSHPIRGFAASRSALITQGAL